MAQTRDLTISPGFFRASTAVWEPSTWGFQGVDFPESWRSRRAGHPGFRIIVRHNGEVWEDFSSAGQIWDTATWIHDLSNYATRYPGDVLWMGTEGADGDMFPGDIIEVEISGIGTLRNHVVTEG